MKEADVRILVVDDTSPDGTAMIVKKHKSFGKKIYLLQDCPKEGLGAAYVRGFTYAIKKLKADIVIEMDADFSHNPADLPRLIREVVDGNDFVIGSRYVSGGSIPKDWSIMRKVNSKFGNILARYIGGLKEVKDCKGDI
jgi:dolichol-phosphate mannosyltransferase